MFRRRARLDLAGQMHELCRDARRHPQGLVPKHSPNPENLLAPNPGVSRSARSLPPSLGIITGLVLQGAVEMCKVGEQPYVALLNSLKVLVPFRVSLVVKSTYPPRKMVQAHTA